jgi:hypothetical protein
MVKSTTARATIAGLCATVATAAQVFSVSAQIPVPGHDHTTLPGATECRLPPLPSWTETEAWIWQRICIGRPANLGERKHSAPRSALDPHDGRPWPADRTITAKFLKTILLVTPYREAIPNEGVHIIGAHVAETLNLENANLRAKLWLESSRFDGDIALDGAISDYSIDLEKSHVSGEFRANSVNVRRMELASIYVGKKFDLTGAKINGYLNMKCAGVVGRLFADLIEVNGLALLDHARFDDKVLLRYAKIAADLDFNHSKLASIDLSGTRVHGQLVFDNEAANKPKCDFEPRTQWTGGTGADPASLVVRNTSADSWRGRKDGWPALNLDGFTYTRFHVDGLGPDGDLGKWGAEWLRKDQSGSTQPYHQYAETITKLGRTTEADAVRFEGRERERQAASGLKFVEMTFARYLIGYGFGGGYFLALGWAAFFVSVGYILLRASSEGRRLREVPNGIRRPITRENLRLRTEREPVSKGHAPPGLLFCIDLLLPLIQFRRSHYDIEFKSKLLAGYFICHRVVGFVLGSFILAGIAGLTK